MKPNYLLILIAILAIFSGSRAATAQVWNQRWALPTKIEAENYKSGGEGVGYHDTTPGNIGGAYRTDDVDISQTSDVGGGYNVGWTAGGEWLAYDVSIATPGTYTFSTRVATPQTGQKLHYELDGTWLSGSLTVPNTGGWETWQDMVSPPIILPSGNHTLKLVFDSAYGPNVNYINITAARIYGVLNSQNGLPTQANYINQDWAIGTRMRTLEVGWNDYEPTENGWNTSYIGQLQTAYNQMRSQGYQVVLDLGLQYPPSWAANICPFKDQYGDIVPATNTVFSNEVRTQVATYLQHIFQDFGGSDAFCAIRIGSGYSADILYPDNVNGNTWCYYGYGSMDTTSNPVPGWIPGNASPSGQASQFYTWYVNSLINNENWLMGTVRLLGFHGIFLPSCGGQGIRGAGLNNLINGNLIPWDLSGTDGGSRGADYASIIAGISGNKNMAIVSSGLAGSYPNVDEASSDPIRWSASHWIAFNADQYGLPKWAENQGENNYSGMQLTFSQMSAYGYTALSWAFDPELYNGTDATSSQYQGMIANGPAHY